MDESGKAHPLARYRVPKGQVLRAQKETEHVPSGFQKVTQMFRGLRMAEKFLAGAGFTTNAWAHNVFGAVYGKLMLEAKVTEPDRVAHVTSYAGYRYDSEKVTAKITTMRDLVKDSHIVRITLSKVDGASLPPIFLSIRDSTDPARETFLGIMTVLRNFAREHNVQIGQAYTLDCEEGYRELKDVIDV